MSDSIKLSEVPVHDIEPGASVWMDGAWQTVRSHEWILYPAGGGYWAVEFEGELLAGRVYQWSENHRVIKETV